jgi:Fe-S oxidoreductase
MGIAPKELHAAGSLVQLRTGSTTGMNPAAARDNFDFIDQEMTEKTGIPIKTPWDVEGADVLLIHNAGEVLAWPENPGAFAVMLTAAGVSWTLSSDLTAYDAVNYGLWYDDVQFARVALRQIEAARKLKVKRIVIGECGHAHKALIVIADRLLPSDLNLPRESSMTLMRDLVLSGRLPVDPARNAFPVTLHDPCNMTRLMGLTEPQRDVLRAVCPDIREMSPNRTDNYCCGGGSGFALMSGKTFLDWRLEIAGARKMEQVLAAFAGCMDPSVPKYICAPCSNCKAQFRDLLARRGLWKSNRIFYGGLAELVVNAMRDAKPGFLEWEWR